MAASTVESFTDTGAVAASHLARGGFAWVAAGAVVARRHGRRVLLETATATWAADTLAVGVSHLVGRRRPCSRFRRSLIECPDSPSFPSQHAAGSFAAALTLARWSPGLRPVVLPLAALVAASRVRVRVHHPTDVLAGAVLGAVVSHTVARCFDLAD